MNELKRVVTLYRVSTLGQVEKDDIPMQKDYCRNFIAEHPDWTLVQELFEKGVSGYKTSAKDRDAIVELQTLAIQEKFDILLVYMFDRLGRRDDETPFVVEWFVQHGVEVWSAKEGQRRFDNHVDKLLNYITFWQASGESVKTSIRTKTRLEQLTTDGYFTGGIATYGYQLVHKGRMNKRNKEVFDLAIDNDAAAIIQLIFRKYVYEGYGTQRISHYLYQQHIFRSDGSDFPRSTISRILKNRMYLGIIHNGDAESEIIPELQIIDQETFDEAQRLMAARATHHSTTPMNMSGHALMKGNIFCGHCGNRLTLATSGHKYIDKNGTEHRTTHFRYRCHYGVNHPDICDGQSVYSVDKLDAIIEEIVLLQLAKIRASNGSEVIEKAHSAHVINAQAYCERIRAELSKKEQELNDYQAEILKAIRGTSVFSKDILAPLISQAQADIRVLTADLEKAQSDLNECCNVKDREVSEFRQLQSWADLYKTCSFDEKKMFLSRFIKHLYVYRDYRLEIEFNVSFEDFQKLIMDEQKAS